MTTILDYGANAQADPLTYMDPEISVAIKSLLQDPAISGALENNLTFYLPDSAT